MVVGQSLIQSEVRRKMRRSRTGACSTPIGARVPADELVLASDMQGLVLFPQADRDARQRQCDLLAALALQRHRIGTWMFALLTDAECADAACTVGLDALAARVGAALERAGAMAGQRQRPCGLVATGAGVAPAMLAAAHWPARVAAVVSRCGRPHEVGASLSLVRAPTLLIAGGADIRAQASSRLATRALRCERRLEFIPDADGSLDAPGVLDGVAALTAQWIEAHLVRRVPV